MRKIKPALTAEDWGKGLIVSGTMGAGIIHHGDVVGVWHHLTPDQRHALAAFCLHGQPFGFTRSDVRIVQMWIDAKRSNDQLQGFVARMESLRDRLEALLPPETEDGAA